MLKTRLIARLDIKGAHLIKSVNLEGVRKIGNPNEFAKRYADDGIDEILFMDAVASLYGRNSLDAIVSDTTSDVFVPMTVGGGLRSHADVRKMMMSGADMVAINTAAVKSQDIIKQIADSYGNQAMVLQIDAKRNGGHWELYIDGGREKTGLDVVEWAQQGESLGAGEILLTSIDREGTGLGFDLGLIRAVSSAVRVPVVASGGCGKPEHLMDALEAGADAVAVARLLHFGMNTVSGLKEFLDKQGVPMRLAA